ncbi:MAG: hypothetical protein KDK66_09665, partial [Deltaproteobacteria bacterium]|nr:hypothetical protein [Deltaproteobacteria bacterium]
TLKVSLKTPKKTNLFDHHMAVLDILTSSPDLKQKGDLELLFTSLFHHAGKVKPQGSQTPLKDLQKTAAHLAKLWLKKYKASMLGIKEDNILKLIENYPFPNTSQDSEKVLRHFIYRIGQDLIFKLIDLKIADSKAQNCPKQIKESLALRKKIQTEIDKKPPFSLRDLQLNGQDLIKMGYKEGQLLGKIIQSLMKRVLDEPKENKAKLLKKYVQEHYPIKLKQNLISKKA